MRLSSEKARLSAIAGIRGKLHLFRPPPAPSPPLPVEPPHPTPACLLKIMYPNQLSAPRQIREPRNVKYCLPPPHHDDTA